MNIIYSQKLSKFSLQHGFSTKSYLNSDHIIFPNQNHTNNVVIAHKNAYKEADSIITFQKNIRIGVKTADCVPILLFEKSKNIIAAVHAGWQGTYKQILRKTVEHIIELGGQPKHIYSCLGPAIGQCCYDIPDFRAEYFEKQFISYKNNQTYLDLKGANIHQLLNAGITRKNIESTPWCTSCNNDMFYSYRREKPLTKQNISYIELIN